MKNQYIGDIGDYGKYGLLRFLIQKGIRLGVNWYLAPNDNRPDGNHVEYLDDDSMRVYDIEVYDEMERLAFLSDKNIQMVEQSGLLEETVFYDEILDLELLDWKERKERRDAWHQTALDRLKGVDLVFADPDTGLGINQKATQKDGQRYIFPNEVMDYFARGQEVVYYHHRSRKKGQGWMDEKTHMRKYLPDAELLAVSSHRWANRAYIFVVHEEKYDFYKQVLDEFLDSVWGTYKVDGKTFFSAEDI